MDVQQLEYQAPLLESPRARPGKPPVAPEADLARGDRDWSLIDALRQREPIAAEEVVQDAFWSVVRKIDSFRGAAAFGSWLYRIVVNAAYHTRRRGHGRRR